MVKSDDGGGARHDEALADEITRLAGQLAAATCRWLELIAEFDRREGWKAWACRSCAHWLNWQCGLDLGAAREKVRVAHRLADLPLVRQRFAAGELSYSKVRALSRVATTDTEADLVELARHATAAHTERLARAYRRAAATADVGVAARQELGRRLTWYHDDDGALVIHARLPAEEGERVLAALRAAEDVSAETPPPVRAADALVRLADGTAPPHPAMLITVDVAELAADDAGTSEPLRRLACDSSVELLAADRSGRRLRLGRRRRTVSAPLRRALEARDRGCRFPGCAARRWLHAHHVRHWLDGGRTDADNLVLLCSHHHKVVHELGWRLRWGEDGQLTVLAPGGRPLDARPAPLRGDLADLDNPAIGPRTITSMWAGEPLDLATTVEVLLWRQHRAGPALYEEAA